MQSVQITVKATHGYGTEKTFETIKKELCERYPLEGHIRWVDYDVPKAAKVIVEIVKFVYVVAVVFIIAFSYIHFSHPVLVTLADKIKENRFKILIMCYLSFAIISNTVTTGAFEVYFDDTLVFSKIRKYRYPTTEDIQRLLVEYVQKRE
ncbi:hypothetical protein WA538_003673 [Blastocystis sp. DL]